MYDTILIPYDGSEEGEKAAEHGIDLAAALGASIHALYVVDLPGVPRTIYLRDDEEELRERYREHGEETTAELCEMAADAGLDCETAIRTGDPGEEIVEYAEEVEEVDAIVMGSAYRGKLSGVLGGVTDKVVRTSHVPVVSCRMLGDE